MGGNYRDEYWGQERGDDYWDRRLEGWDAIATIVKRGRTWCIEQADPQLEDPLPVSYPGRKGGQKRGTPTVTFRRLYRWMVRNRLADPKPGMLTDLPCQGCGTWTEHAYMEGFSCTDCGRFRAA